MNGFYLYTPQKEYFYKSNNKNLTVKIIYAFIDKIGEVKHFTPETISKVKKDMHTIENLRYRIQKMQLENKETYFSIHNDGSTNIYPEKDFYNDVIIFWWRLILWIHV